MSGPYVPQTPRKPWYNLFGRRTRTHPDPNTTFTDHSTNDDKEEPPVDSAEAQQGGPLTVGRINYILKNGLHADTPASDAVEILTQIKQVLEALGNVREMREKEAEHEYHSFSKALHGLQENFMQILGSGMHALHTTFNMFQSHHQQHYPPLTDSVMFNPMMFGGGGIGPYVIANPAPIFV